MVALAILESLKEGAAQTWDERLMQLLLLSVIAGLVVICAWRLGLFTRLLPPIPSSFVRFRHVLIAFLLFFLAVIVIVPMFAASVLFTVYETTDIMPLITDPFVQGWVAASGMFVAATVLWIYSRIFLDIHTRYEVWGRHVKLKTAIKNFLIGAASSLVAFPVSSFIGQLVEGMLLLIKPDASLDIDQVALGLLKSVAPYPLLLGFVILTFIVVGPIVEEILFRGFLQTWLKARLGNWKAIILSSLIFASFHFSASQGYTNVTLLTTLFALSLFMGYIYERQQSLLAPIGLHMAFNAMGVAAALWG